MNIKKKWCSYLDPAPEKGYNDIAYWIKGLLKEYLLAGMSPAGSTHQDAGTS